MKIAGSTTLPAPRERVWKTLLDPRALAKTLPGCESLEPVGPDEYRVKMKLAVAAVQGLFAGKVKLSEQRPPESYRLSLVGSGRIGHVNGGGEFRLEETDEGASTAVHYSGEVKVGGMIAAVGQRLMDRTAKMMIERFFKSLTSILEEDF